MTNAISIFKFLFCFGILAISLACGGGGSEQGASGENVRFRFKAQDGDQLIAYTLNGNSLLSPTNAFSSSSLDPSTGLSELNLSKSNSYRIRLSRQGVEFLDTIVLIDQFVHAQNGVLDIGEINALTTLMTWGAIRGANLIPNLSVEAAVKQQLSNINLVSNIRLLSDIVPGNIDENVFGADFVAQMNLTVISLARLSYAIRDQNIDQKRANEVMQLLNDIFAAVNRNQSLAENLSLRDNYIQSLNTSGNALPLALSSNVQNQWVNGNNLDIDNFINLSQSVNSQDTDALFKKVGLN
jgi:hypothetical protein